MEINGTRTPSASGGRGGGYHLIVLGNIGEVIWNQLYRMTGAAATDSATNNQSPRHPAAARPTALRRLLQGFGTLPALADHGNLANVIQNIGGRADVVSRFNGKPDNTGGVYALIAGPSTSLQTGWSTLRGRGGQL